MIKYDFGYEIKPGTTHQWAFDIIKPNSFVLEVGPAFGILTKNLVDKLHCTVDIVEKDSESGTVSSKFARKALIGPQGDIENENCLGLLGSEQYDYIVILDVIEHLLSPEKVLGKIGRFLKPNGEILLSTPNISHNSVIINLMNNKFQYTSLGILDSTHTHFYTKESLQNLIQSCGYTMYRLDKIRKLVGENEIP